MALSTFAGTFLTSTAGAGNTVVVTGVGFTPKAVIFYWVGRTEAIDTIGRASHFRGFGFACSPTDRRAICVTSADAVASSNGGRHHTDAACVISSTNAGVLDAALDLQSMDADGFTLVIDDNWLRNQRIGFLALGGSDLTNAATGALTEPGATGNADTTSLAFQPDCVLFISNGESVAPPAGDATISNCSFGAAVSSAQRGIWMGAQDDSSGTMDARSYCIGTECAGIQDDTVGGSIVARADFVSFLSNGFRLNWLEISGAARYYHFLALKGGSFRVDNLLTQTDTVTDIVESGFGFAPTGALLLSAGKAQDVADTATAHDRLSVGAFSGVTQRNAQAVLDEDALADSEVTTALEFDAVYANISTSSTIDGLMDVKSIDADGFTMIMDDADPAQAFVWYLAVGDAPVGAGQPMALRHTLDRTGARSFGRGIGQ